MDETQGNATTTDIATDTQEPTDVRDAVIAAAAHVVATRRAITPSDQSRAAELPTALDALEAAVSAAGLDSQG